MKDLLKVKDLIIHYETSEGVVQAINGIDLTVEEGSVFGLVGETGAGKTTLAKGIMGLIPHPPGKVKGGEILFQGRDLLAQPESELRRIRGREISMIFQDPMTSLNPVIPVGEQIAEVIENHKKVSKSQAREQAREMLELVGITPSRYGEYPHQFSGGMKQRVIIAIALACNPRLLIADEPTTALDVTIQAQILKMMGDLREERNTSILLITHDLGVIAQNCDQVAVMYAGEIVEQANVYEIFKNPVHPYTIGLLGAIPKLTEDVRRLTPIDGLMPDPTRLASGCRFADRCKQACVQCGKAHPEMTKYAEGHFVRCHLHRS